MHRAFKTAMGRHTAGFTLIEMIVVIAVVVIIGTMSTGFIRTSIFSYVSTETNTELAGEADFALKRVARDMRNALPNSLRVTASGQNSYLEFVPIAGAGRYRAGLTAAASGDFLNFEAADTSFDVFGPALTLQSGSQLVIYNLGINNANVYDGSNVSAISTTGSNVQNISFAAKQFTLSSPNNRFFVVRGASSYACDLASGNLYLYQNYNILQNQPSSIAALDALTNRRIVVSGLSDCAINYNAGVLQRSGVVTVALQLRRNGAVVNLMQMVTVVNSP